jgi:hypothetical protein
LNGGITGVNVIWEMSIFERQSSKGLSSNNIRL